MAPKLPDSARERICRITAHGPGLAALLDEIPVAVAVLDSDRRVVMVNRAYEALTGCFRSDILGHGCFHALRCDYFLRGCPVLKDDSSFTPEDCSADILTRSRRKVPVRLTLAPLTDGSGRPAGYIETVRETTLSGGLGDTGDAAYALGGLIGKSHAMEQLFRLVPSVAQTDSSVLITGETGTGKDMLAEAIHKASNRVDSPFVKVNCGALPDTLLESEIFGHAKGAFTGADKAKPGRFRLAHGGTLFLTEIGDLPLALQVKLLSFLDDKVIYPLGSTEGFHADVRVVVATHRDLDEMVEQKRFRQDLLFRLNVVRLHLPPLRQREEDVPLLKGHFLRHYCARFKKNIRGFSRRVQDILEGYPFPGNVRELRNIVEYAVNFCDEDLIQVHHLPAYLAERPAMPCPDAATGASRPEAQGSGGSVDIEQADNWDEVERKMILDALVRAGGRRERAARLLGWGRSTMWRKMKKHNIIR